MEHLLTDDILNLLRRIGDPLVDAKAKDVPAATRDALMEKAREKGLDPLRNADWLKDHAAEYDLEGLLKYGRTLPDPDLVKTACDLFARYGSEIAAALLLAALPEAYAAGGGAKVLFQRSQLIEGGEVSTKRILSTAQFVIWILTPGTLSPPVSHDMATYTYPQFDATERLWGELTGQALCASLALRITHSLIRNAAPVVAVPVQPDAGSVPLNQEDLLATLLSFSITVFEVLEKFGISWSEEEQEAYFYVWDRVGQTMGIGDFHVIATLTGVGSFEELRWKLRDYEERDPSADPGKGGDDTVTDEAEKETATEEPGKGEGEAADSEAQKRGEAVPTGADAITPAEVDDLFRGPRNRRVLRRIADMGTLRPRSVPEARVLLARLRERMWTLDNDRPPNTEPYTYETFKEILDDVSAGRILLRALVDAAVAQLPPSQTTWPIAVIRQLVPPRVQNRLALGGTGPVGLISGIVNTQRDMVGSVALRRMTASILRQRATRVADSLFLYWYDQGQLEIPGLRSAALGYGVRK